MKLTDALGRELALAAPARRIVSLVPSITETLFELGAGDAVVGVTDYCVHPADATSALPRLGGTKNPSLERIVELRPDLVLANKEENRRRSVEALEARGLAVFVTYARTVSEAVDEIALLGQLTERPAKAAAIVDRIEQSRAHARACVRDPRPRTVALVWKSPYMAVGGDTFAHDLLVEAGAENPFASAERRYPRLDEDGLVRARPDVILLPTEPYAFGAEDRAELLRLDCPAAREGRVHVVEGELLSWYGPRIARALEVFSELLSG